MKRTVWLLSLLALGVVLTAWAASDFSGTWALDKAKSDPIRMGRPGGGGGGGGDIDVTLVIKQTANEITITRKMSAGGGVRTSEQKFTLDGKESTNPAPMGRGEFKAKANLQGDKLTIEGTQKMSTQQGDFEIGVKEEYVLSDGGKVLTITGTRSTPQGDRTSKQVYNSK